MGTGPHSDDRSSTRIIRYSGQFDPAPHLAILDATSGDLLKRLDIARVSSNSKETLGFELLSTTKELLTIHRNGFALWDLKTAFPDVPSIWQKKLEKKRRTTPSDLHFERCEQEEKTHLRRSYRVRSQAFALAPTTIAFILRLIDTIRWRSYRSNSIPGKPFPARAE